MSIFALSQEKAIFIVSKFEYAQCIVGRPVKRKPNPAVSRLSHNSNDIKMFYKVKKKEISKPAVQNLQTNTITTIRNVTSDFRVHFCNVIIHA